LNPAHKASIFNLACANEKLGSACFKEGKQAQALNYYREAQTWFKNAINVE